jgi:hypothetical protein
VPLKLDVCNVTIDVPTLLFNDGSVILAHTAVIPGMNAIAFTREVLAIFGEPRRMVFCAVLAALALAGTTMLILPRGQITRCCIRPLSLRIFRNYP